MLRRTVLPWVLIAGPLWAWADTLSFRQGENNGFGVYTGATDTWIDETLANADTNFGADTLLRVDLGSGIDRQSLMRLSGIFGTNAGQILPGVTITSASLTINIENAGLSRMPTRMLQDWDASTLTWNNAKLGGNTVAGIQPDGSEAVAETDAFNANVLGPWILDVTTVVQDWSNGAPNYGVLFHRTNTDALAFTSSDGATVTQRPLLTVNYVVPEPGTAGLLAGVMILSQMLRRSRQ